MAEKQNSNEIVKTEQEKQLEKDTAKSLKESIGEKTETPSPDINANLLLEDKELANPKTGDLADSKNLMNADAMSEADIKFNALLDDELRKKMVDDEVARRMLAHRQGAGAVNTDNPYNVKAGEKVTYIVNGEAVDANGNSVASK